MSQLGAACGGGTATILVPDATTTLTIGDRLLIGCDAATANGTFTAGQSGLTGGPTITVGGPVILGRNGGSGTFNQESGLTVSTSPAIVGDFDGPGGSPGVGVLNLDGGTFQAPAVTTRSTDAHVVGTSGTINFNGGVLKATADNPAFIAADSPAATMTLDVKTGGAIIDTNGCNIGIALPLLHAGVGADGGLTKLGAGTLVLSGANTYNGPTTVQQGTVQFNGPDARNPVIGVGGGADLQHGWSKMGFDYSGEGDTTPAETILGLLHDSYHGGAWDIGTFCSSTAAAEGTTLGWKDDPGTKQVTIMSTLAGDCDLSGSVDFNDLGYVVGNYGMTGATWADGDMTYDGNVDFDDLGFVVGNYGGVLPAELDISGGHLDAAGLAVLGAHGITAVPEPGTLALLATGLLSLLAFAWRRRRS